MNTHRLYVVALGAVVAALAAIGSAGGGETGAAAPSQVSGSISVIGEADGLRDHATETVFKDFNRLYPNVEVKFTSAARNLPTVLGTARPGRQPA